MVNSLTAPHARSFLRLRIRELDDVIRLFAIAKSYENLKVTEKLTVVIEISKFSCFTRSPQYMSRTRR